MTCRPWLSRDFLTENGWSRRDLADRAGARHFLQSQSDHYVYVLWTAVGADLAPFYVGLGRGWRAIRHSNPSSHDCNRIKRALWRRCVDAGGTILYSFPAAGLCREAATECEVALIARLGRRLDQTGPLSNITIGGEGSNGANHRKGGRSPKAKPIVAEGQTFPSKHEASTALGLTPQCILSRLRAGWPGYHYMGEEPFPCRKGRRKGADNTNSRAVIVGGARYETVTSAALALGVHPPAITRRITRGWPECYYEDEGPRAVGRRRAYQISVDGVEYSSTLAASKALGIPRPTITWRLRQGEAGYSSQNPVYQ